MSAPWRVAAALVFVEDVEGPELTPDDTHHLQRVLRLRPGSPIVLSDGRDRVRPASLGDRGALDDLGDIEVLPPVDDPVTVGVAPPKGERLEWLVGRLCELGVDSIQVLTADRSVVRWDGDRWERAADRLRRVVRSAASQCRRPRLPVVVRADLEDLLREGVPVADLEGRLPGPSDRHLLIGPEGGWSERERDLAVRGGGRVRLAGDVLRVETAAVAAASTLGLARLRRSTG